MCLLSWAEGQGDVLRAARPQLRMWLPRSQARPQGFQAAASCALAAVCRGSMLGQGQQGAAAAVTSRAEKLREKPVSRRRPALQAKGPCARTHAHGHGPPTLGLLHTYPQTLMHACTHRPTHMHTHAHAQRHTDRHMLARRHGHACSHTCAARQCRRRALASWCARTCMVDASGALLALPIACRPRIGEEAGGLTPR